MRRHGIWALVLMAGGCVQPDPVADLPPPPAAFVAYDTDGRQASLSREEYRVLGEEVFDELDLNQDGHLSRADFRTPFETLDLDGDGYVDLDEVPALVAAGDQDGDGRLSPEEFEKLDLVLERWDRDGDGRVSPTEWDYESAARFQEADRNRNGYIGTLESPRFTLFRL